MARLAMVSAVMIGLLPSGAMAGQTSSSFTVGITIGGGKQQAARVLPSKTYTWGAAAISVRAAGFANPRRVEKSDTLYWFAAERGRDRFRIAVSVFSGAVVKVIPA